MWSYEIEIKWKQLANKWMWQIQGHYLNDDKNVYNIFDVQFIHSFILFSFLVEWISIVWRTDKCFHYITSCQLPVEKRSKPIPFIWLMELYGMWGFWSTEHWSLFNFIHFHHDWLPTTNGKLTYSHISIKPMHNLHSTAKTSSFDCYFFYCWYDNGK